MCLGETRCVKCNVIWSESIVTSNIFVGSMQVSHPQLAKTLIDGLHVESPLSHSWVCGACYSALKNELSLSLLLHEAVSANDPTLKCRNSYVNKMVTILSKDGIILNTNYKNMFNFFFAATTSSKGKHRKEDSSRHDLKRTLCIRMAVSILCLAMNP